MPIFTDKFEIRLKLQTLTLILLYTNGFQGGHCAEWSLPSHHHLPHLKLTVDLLHFMACLEQISLSPAHTDIFVSEPASSEVQYCAGSFVAKRPSDRVEPGCQWRSWCIEWLIAYSSRSSTASLQSRLWRVRRLRPRDDECSCRSQRHVDPERGRVWSAWGLNGRWTTSHCCQVGARQPKRTGRQEPAHLGSQVMCVLTS